MRTKESIGVRMHQYRACYAMILPFFLLFGIFIVLPIGIAVIFSFTDFNMLEWPGLVGIENYIKLFLEDDVFLVAVRNTLIFAVITGPVSYFACLLFAWLINELDRRVRAVMTFFFYAPSISGTLYVMWSYIFSGDMYGWLNYLLMSMNLISEPVQWLSDPSTMLGVIIFIQIWMSLGTSFLSFIAGLQNVDKQLYEAAAVTASATVAGTHLCHAALHGAAAYVWRCDANRRGLFCQLDLHDAGWFPLDGQCGADGRYIYLRLRQHPI